MALKSLNTTNEQGRSSHSYHMSDYNIPNNIQELFTEVLQHNNIHYHIHDHNQPGDNIYGMDLFLNCLDITDEDIAFYDGTQVFLSHNHHTIQIDSSGGGDFHLHEYDIKVVDPIIIN